MRTQPGNEPLERLLDAKRHMMEAGAALSEKAADRGRFPSGPNELERLRRTEAGNDDAARHLASHERARSQRLNERKRGSGRRDADVVEGDDAEGRAAHQRTVAGWWRPKARASASETSPTVA